MTLKVPRRPRMIVGGRWRYLPIAGHGLIGDLHTGALVETDWTIDWYCSPADRFRMGIGSSAASHIGAATTVRSIAAMRSDSGDGTGRVGVVMFVLPPLPENREAVPALLRSAADGSMPLQPATSGPTSRPFATSVPGHAAGDS